MLLVKAIYTDMQSNDKSERYIGFDERGLTPETIFRKICKAIIEKNAYIPRTEKVTGVYFTVVSSGTFFANFYVRFTRKNIFEIFS